MARSRSRRRPGRMAATGGPRPAPGRDPAVRRAAAPRAGWWRGHWRAALVGSAALLAIAALAVANALLHRPPSPDAAGLHSAIQARQAGSEVTFTGTLVNEPATSGGHERMLVRTQLGDTLELDYNVTLGRTVPLHQGDSIAVHGQLYLDPGRAGVHCLHEQTSRGCPEPGWIDFAGSRYS